MKPFRRYLAVGVAAYVLILVASFPAGFVRTTLQQAMPGLELGMVSGSVFYGRSEAAAFHGQAIGPVDWRIRPLALLLLRLEYRLHFSHPDNRGTIDVGMRADGDMYGRALQMQLIPDPLANRFSPVALQLGGILNLALEQFAIESGQVKTLTGSLVWSGAAVEAPLAVPLGELELSLESRDNTLAAVVTRGGSLGVSGELLLYPGNRYSVDLRMKPVNDGGSGIYEMLETVLEPHPAGGFGLKVSGRMDRSPG